MVARSVTPISCKGEEHQRYRRMENELREQLHQMDVENIRLVEKLKQELTEEKMIRKEERQKASQREQELLTKINALNSDKQSGQDQLGDAVRELNVSG